MLRKLIVVILAAVVTGGFWFGSQMTVKQKLRKEPVVIAIQDIPARTQITENMVKVISLPASGIPPGVARKKEEVVGKYTMSNFGIPKNGYFFLSVVKSVEELPDGALMLLKPGEEMIAMNVDLQKYLGGNAVPGTYVNLWFSAKQSNKVPIVGKFMENVRVLGARDQKAMETTKQSPSETSTKDKSKSSGTSTPSTVAKVLLLAVPKEDVKYFFMAQAVGQVYPTGIQEAVQVQEASDVMTGVLEARRWLEANVRVLGAEQQAFQQTTAAQQ